MCLSEQALEKQCTTSRKAGHLVPCFIRMLYFPYHYLAVVIFMQLNWGCANMLSIQMEGKNSPSVFDLEDSHMQVKREKMDGPVSSVLFSSSSFSNNPAWLGPS